MYEDLEDSTTQLKPRRKRGVGFTERRARSNEWKFLKKQELRETSPDLTDEELDKAADKAYEESRSDAHSVEALRIFEETAPVSRSPRPSDLIPDLLIAAMCWLGPMRWLKSVFLKGRNRRGFCADKTLALAIFLQMALGQERPEIASTFRSFTGESRPLRAWAHDYPSIEIKRPTVYEGVQTKLFPVECGPGVIAAVSVEGIKRLAEKHNKTSWPRPGRRRKGERVLIGEIGIVDGSQIPAGVEQRRPMNRDHKRLLHGNGRERVGHVVHVDKDGKIHKEVTGYLMVTLADMASTLPYGVVIMPANGNEREAIALLLKIIFEVWPDCPMNTLVGDGLFHNSKALAHELVFNWGVQPIFPTSEKGFSKELSHFETEGVPTCGCGKLMKLKDTSDFYTAERRAREGIPRGVLAPNLKARLRWECSVGKGGCGMKAETRPIDEPRLYTFYPRRGDHVRAIERRVLLLRRNAVESIFASLKNLGLGTGKFNCPSWAKDLGMEWLLAIGMYGLVARRLAYEEGLYDLAYAEAEGLGLLTPATETNPAPGPDEMTVRRARRQREEILDERQPANPPHGHGHLLGGEPPARAAGALMA